MNDELKAFEKTLKKKHSVRFTPKYEETITTSLPVTVFSHVVAKVFETLEWDVVYEDDNLVEAKHNGGWRYNGWSEKISVTYEYGEVKVHSESLGSEMWDKGRNSLRVKMFIHVFALTEKEYDREAIAALEKELKRAENMDDYVIPDSLPQPPAVRAPKLWIPAIGGLVIALLLGLVVAFFSSKGIYIIFLFEIGVGFAMAYCLKHLVKLGNYTNSRNLLIVLAGMVAVTYVANQYLQYQFILFEHNLEPIGFFNFLQIRLEKGFVLNGKMNLGAVGLVVVWLVQLGLTYFVGMFLLINHIVAYQLQRVPMEVTEFVIYYMVKGKTADEIKTELTKKGWSEEQNQQEVFEAVGGLVDARELNR